MKKYAVHINCLLDFIEYVEAENEEEAKDKALLYIDESNLVSLDVDIEEIED